MMDKGAPEMESIMGCFTGKKSAETRLVGVISYFTSG
jgi:hypothetical protein